MFETTGVFFLKSGKKETKHFKGYNTFLFVLKAAGLSQRD